MAQETTAPDKSTTTDPLKSMFSHSDLALAEFDLSAYPFDISAIETMQSNVLKHESKSAQDRANYLDTIIDYCVKIIFSIFEARDLIGEPDNSQGLDLVEALSVLLDKLFRSKVLGPEISVANLSKVILLAAEKSHTVHEICAEFSYPILSSLLNGKLDRTNLLVALLRTLSPKTTLRAWLTNSKDDIEQAEQHYKKRSFYTECLNLIDTEGNSVREIFNTLIHKFHMEMVMDGVKYLKFYGKCEKNPCFTCPELRLDELMKEIDDVIWRVNKCKDKNLIKDVDHLLELLIDYCLDRDQTIFDHLSLVPEGKSSPLARYLQSMIDAKLKPPVPAVAKADEKLPEPKENETTEGEPSAKKAKPNDTAEDADDDLAILKQIMNMQQTLLNSQQQLLAKLIPFVGASDGNATCDSSSLVNP